MRRALPEVSSKVTVTNAGGSSGPAPQGPLTLAIDTSAASSSIALSKQGEVIASLAVTEVRQHSQVIFEHIEALTSLAGIRVEEIGLFAAVTGPGSFTGLRIGLAALEGIAAALSRPIAGVTTFDASAATAGVRGPIATLVDAGRGDVFMGIRELDPNAKPQVIGSDFVGSLVDALSLVQKSIGGRGALLTGTACKRYHSEIVAMARTSGIELVSSELRGADSLKWCLDARAVAMAPAAAVLATRVYLSGTLPALRPYYLKPSDAEAKWKRLEA